MHSYKTSNLEFSLGSCVVKLVTLFDDTLIDSYVCKLTVLPVLQLECQGYSRHLRI